MQFAKRQTNLGTMKRGSKKTHIFEFTNVGSVDLEIDSWSACECSNVTYEKKVYKPGDSGEITVVFDSTEKEDNDPVTIDLFLKQTFPGYDVPIIEQLEYTFELID